MTSGEREAGVGGARGTAWRAPEVGERAIITGHDILKSFVGKGCVVSAVSSFLTTNPKSVKATSKVWVKVDGIEELEYGMYLRDLALEPKAEPGEGK